MKRFIFLFLLAFGFVVCGCGAPQSERRKPETAFIGEGHPQQESWDINLNLTDAGVPKASIQAGYAAEFNKNSKKEYHLQKGVTVIFFNSEKEPSTILKAQEAVVHDNLDIEARGNITITTDNTTTIKTESIKRTAKDRMIRSHDYVTITRPGETLAGYGFESDQALKKYRIFRASGESN